MVAGRVGSHPLCAYSLGAKPHIFKEEKGRFGNSAQRSFLFSPIWNTEMAINIDDPHISTIASIIQSITSILGLILGFFAILYARQQIIPLRRSIDSLIYNRRISLRRVYELRRSMPRKSYDVKGFDPRFSDTDWAQLLISSFSNNQLFNGRPARNINFRLSRSYGAFSNELEGGQILSGNTILLIDLAMSAQYIKEGTIIPLSTIRGFEFETAMERRALSYGTQFDPGFTKIAKMLCSDAAGNVAALPLWVNSQGRFISETDQGHFSPPITASPSLKHILERADATELLRKAGVQTAVVSSAVFEFWGHLAYRDCVLFRTTIRNGTSHIRTNIGTRGSDDIRFIEAVADYAVRLRFSELTGDYFSKVKDVKDLRNIGGFFEIRHGEDARSLRDGVALWKPVFSSELLTRALPNHPTMEIGEALFDENSFKPPLARRLSASKWTYLSAIGGYGLAISAGAEDPRDALRALEYVFLSNPLIRHEYLLRMIPDDHSEASLNEFVEAHARPRWPFWRKVEAALTECIMHSLIIVASIPAKSPAAFWEAAAEKLRSSPHQAALLRAFVEEVREIAQKNDYVFDTN